MELTTITIKDWHEFSKEIKELGYKSWIFRGHSSLNWSLESSLYRELTLLNIPTTSWGVREKDILRSFRECGHHYLTHVPKEEDILEWWSLMQHFGAPTRLLDWTYSPYIAAFFAIEKAVKCDFCVYGLYIGNIKKHNKKTPPVNLRKYDWFGKDKASRIELYAPALRNQRLISQQGVFTVQSIIGSKFEDIIKEYPSQTVDKGKGFVRFIFENKGDRFGEYISFLHRMNITNASLFPGLEGLSRSLRLDLMNIGTKF